MVSSYPPDGSFSTTEARAAVGTCWSRAHLFMPGSLRTFFADTSYSLRQEVLCRHFLMTCAMRGGSCAIRLALASAAVLTLALGIGATTAIFTLVYDVLLKPLPYSHPEQLLVMEEQVAEFRDIYPTPADERQPFRLLAAAQSKLPGGGCDAGSSYAVGLGGHPLQIGVLRLDPRHFFSARFHASARPRFLAPGVPTRPRACCGADGQPMAAAISK